MKLSEICVKRPVFTIVITLIPILLGFIVFTNVPVKFAPFLGTATINIQVNNVDGMSEEQKNKTVMRPILNTLGTIKGIEKTTSSTQKNQISLDISQDVDIDDTVTQVNNKINEIKDDLPAGVATVVAKSSTQGMMDEIIISKSDSLPFIPFINDYNLRIPDLFNQINDVGAANNVVIGYQNFIIKLYPR